MCIFGAKLLFFSKQKKFQNDELLVLNNFTKKKNLRENSANSFFFDLDMYNGDMGGVPKALQAGCLWVVMGKQKV